MSDDEKTYKVYKFQQHQMKELVHEGLTLEEAQEICNQEDTTGEDWFYGYMEE